MYDDLLGWYMYSLFRRCIDVSKLMIHLPVNELYFRFAGYYTVYTSHVGQERYSIFFCLYT